MKPVLITAFDAFGGSETNSSQEAIVQLGKVDSIAEVAEFMILPTTYHRCFEVVKEQIDTQRPRFVLGLGEAGGRTALCLERVAINIAEANIRDNDGVILRETHVVEGSREALFATLPLPALAAELIKEGIPTQISNSAGTFVCNAYLYHLLTYALEAATPYQAGFIHIPYMPSLAASKPTIPSMETTTVVRALAKIVTVLLSK